MPTELNGNSFILSNFVPVYSLLQKLYLYLTTKNKQKKRKKLRLELLGHKRKCNLHIFAFTIVLNKLEQQMNINDNVQWSVWINTIYLQARWPVPADQAAVRLPLTLHNTGNYFCSISSCSYCWELDTESTQDTQTHINNPQSDFVSICFALRAASIVSPEKYGNVGKHSRMLERVTCGATTGGGYWGM